MNNKTLASFAVVLLLVLLFRERLFGQANKPPQQTNKPGQGVNAGGFRPRMNSNSTAPNSGIGTAGQMAEVKGLNTSKILKRGDRGEEVKYLQQLLQEEIYLLRGEDDGIFGPKTENALLEARGTRSISIDQFLQ